MMWWNHGGWDAGDWLAMSFMMVIFWGGLIALVVWLARSARDRSGPSIGQPDAAHRADDVLSERRS